MVSQIETALHPEFVAILTRKPGDNAYLVLAARPAVRLAIPASGRLMSLLRVLGKPLEIEQTETGWLRRQLPPEESDFVTRARLEWIFPISLAVDQTEALVALGPKLSGEHFPGESRGPGSRQGSGLRPGQGDRAGRGRSDGNARRYRAGRPGRHGALHVA